MVTPSHRSTPDQALLVTKFAAPPVQPRLVSRPRLLQRLQDGRAGRLTLVSAPAGFGKTTLVSAWVQGMVEAGHESPLQESAVHGSPPQESPVRVAWLTLEEEDNDPARFLSYLIAALRQVDARIGQSVQPLLGSPQPPQPEALLTALINDVVAASRPCVLVLDDYHVIHTLPIHQQLAFLLGHQPPQTHVVICTREDPPLPLSRLRASGQVNEIRQADLAFTPEEAAAFLQQTMRLNLNDEDVGVLQTRTEGWIAGLQLAALSLRGSEDTHAFVRSFGGSHRFVLDYLIDEVLQRQPAEVQDFLLQTAVLDRLSAPLCDAVTGRQDGQRLLQVLDQANLFVVSLDTSRQWYRYHRLFAELLRHRLARQGAVDARVLHRRASEWFAAHGFPADAVRHALAAEDWERAADLIYAQCSSLLSRGEVATLMRWIGSLPQEVVRAHAKLSYEYSWALILSGQNEAAESCLQVAEQAAQDDLVLQGRIAVARGQIALRRGNVPSAIEWSRRALSLLPKDDVNTRSIVGTTLGMSHWYLGQLQEAREALSGASAAALQAGNRHAAAYAQSFVGRIEAAQGRLSLAVEHYRQGIELGGEQPPSAMSYIGLGGIHYEQNNLAQAEQAVQRGIELSEQGGALDILLSGQASLALIHLAQGSAAVALQILEAAQQRASQVAPDAVIHALLAACHVRVALAVGDLGIAQRQAERLGERPDGLLFYPLLRLTPVRLILAQGRKAVAAERLATLYALASRAGWQYGALEVRVLQALAASNLSEALAFLAEALSKAEPEGFVRIFLDKGEPLASLLREAATHDIMPGYTSRLLAARTRPGRMSVSAEGVARRDQPLPERLSDRELEVLRLLAAGQTNDEVAEALFISLNTVKTHLKNIYAKLGASSRREAVAKATELRLLP